MKRFAPSLEFAIPNGACFSKDGFLFIAERNRILVFPAAEFFYESPDVAVGEVVKQGELIPGEEECFNHTARVCAVGPDKKLYMQLGQPYNVPPKEKAELYKKVGIGGIIRMNRDGTEREVFADRPAQPGRHGLQPGHRRALDQRQPGRRHGRRHPAGRAQPHHRGRAEFRLPVVRRRQRPHSTNTRTASRRPTRCSPVVETIAHAADLGMLFYTGNKFPAKYKKGVFTAQHGSWNRTEPVGARVLFTPLNDDGTAAGEQEEFAAGWLNADGEYIGRPVDVAQLRDGSILVSDDFAGAVYRISYSQ